jgi:hypothetical protein
LNLELKRAAWQECCEARALLLRDALEARAVDVESL